MVLNNSHSTDKFGSTRTGNSHHIRTIRTDSSCTPDNQIRLRLLRPQFRLKPERQNSALERKPVRLPSVQLREVFSL